MERYLIYFIAGIGCVCSRFFVEQPEVSIPALTEVIQDVTRKPETHDVLLVSAEFQQTEKLRLINEIVANTVVPFWPTMMISINNETVLKRPSKIQATQRTTAIVVHSPSNAVENHKQEGIAIVYAFLNVTTVNDNPKMLIVLVRDNAPFNFFLYLHFYFTSRMINVAVVEVADCEAKPCLVVHEFNPFLRSYSSRSYERGRYNPFPNKLQNLYGHPFKINYLNQPPYLLVSYKNGKKTFTGMSVAYFDAIQETLNVTLKYGITKMDCDLNGLLTALNSNLIHFSTTNAIGEDKVCGCMPIVKTRLRISIWDIIPVILSGILIVGLFWLFLKLLQIKWDMSFNIFTLIVGMSAESIPNSLSGKIMFLSLVVTVTRYSSLFYKEIFNLAVISEEDLKISSFEDVTKAGMGVFLSEDMYYAMRHLNIPKNIFKSLRTYTNEEHITAMQQPEMFHKNMTFLLTSACQCYIHRLGSEDKRRLLKLSDLCPITYTLAFLLPHRSHLHDQINDIVLRVREAGLTSRYEIGPLILENFHYYLPPYVSEDSTSTEDRLSKYIMAGYVISILIFICEVVLQRFRNRRLMRTNVREEKTVGEDHSEIC